MDRALARWPGAALGPQTWSRQPPARRAGPTPGAGAGPAEEPFFSSKRFLRVREMEYVSRHIFQGPQRACFSLKTIQITI